MPGKGQKKKSPGTDPPPVIPAGANEKIEDIEAPPPVVHDDSAENPDLLAAATATDHPVVEGEGPNISLADATVSAQNHDIPEPQIELIGSKIQTDLETIHQSEHSKISQIHSTGQYLDASLQPTTSQRSQVQKTDQGPENTNQHDLMDPSVVVSNAPSAQISPPPPIPPNLPDMLKKIENYMITVNEKLDQLIAFLLPRNSPGEPTPISAIASASAKESHAFHQLHGGPSELPQNRHPAGLELPKDKGPKKRANKPKKEYKPDMMELVEVVLSQHPIPETSPIPKTPEIPFEEHLKNGVAKLKQINMEDVKHNFSNNYFANGQPGRIKDSTEAGAKEHPGPNKTPEQHHPHVPDSDQHHQGQHEPHHLKHENGHEPHPHHGNQGGNPEDKQHDPQPHPHHGINADGKPEDKQHDHPPHPHPHHGNEEGKPEDKQHDHQPHPHPHHGTEEGNPEDKHQAHPHRGSEGGNPEDKQHHHQPHHGSEGSNPEDKQHDQDHHNEDSGHDEHQDSFV